MALALFDSMSQCRNCTDLPDESIVRCWTYVVLNFIGAGSEVLAQKLGWALCLIRMILYRSVGIMVPSHLPEELILRFQSIARVLMFVDVYRPSFGNFFDDWQGSQSVIII